MNQSILSGLMKYNTGGSYPWHMPGHKRRLSTIFPDLVENPFLIDVTEVDGLDEFHNPTGIIKESLSEASKIYGSDASYYLVNGSTSGVLAAISAVCKPGDTIIVARNCHTSVYYAIRLLHLKPVYIIPEWNKEIRMFGGVLPETVKKALKQHPQAKAVVLVSPTYEGVVSDIEAIAKLVHKEKKPLIVDEAHGAHFEYMANVNEAISATKYKEMPQTATRLLADIVIESLHKTLPAMTQCAILHIKGNLVSKRKLEEFLSIYQSSSPSYVFMASIEGCIEKMDHERDGLFIIYKELLMEYRKKFGELKKIHLVDIKDFKKKGAYSYDPGKLVFSVFRCGIKTGEERKALTGIMLSKILNDEYGQTVEMATDNYIIAMTSVADTREAFEALYVALKTIDETLIDLTDDADIYNEDDAYHINLPDSKMGIGQAMDAKQTEVSLTDAVGRISGAYIYAYPPGIPLVTPGEIISKEMADGLLTALRRGHNIKGLSYDKDNLEMEKIKVYIVRDNKWSTRKRLFNHGQNHER